MGKQHGIWSGVGFGVDPRMLRSHCIENAWTCAVAPPTSESRRLQAHDDVEVEKDRLVETLKGIEHRRYRQLTRPPPLRVTPEV
jgi:hypothetical protein